MAMPRLLLLCGCGTVEADVAGCRLQVGAGCISKKYWGSRRSTAPKVYWGTLNAAIIGKLKVMPAVQLAGHSEMAAISPRLAAAAAAEAFLATPRHTHHSRSSPSEIAESDIGPIYCDLYDTE